MRIVVSGGWSYGNIGDEVIAASTIFLLKKYFPDAEMFYTSYNVDDFFYNHGITAYPSVHRILTNLQAEELVVDRILNNIREYNLLEYERLFDKETIFVMSGGGYFHEHWKSQFVSRLVEIEIAKKASAKIIIIGQSIGPVYSDGGKELLSRSLNKCDYICVRDTSSLELLQSMNLSVSIGYAPDLALIISDIISPINSISKNIISIMPANYSKYIDINSELTNDTMIKKIVNRLSVSKFNYKKQFKKFIKYIIENTEYNVCFVMSTMWSWDKKFMLSLTKNLNESRYTICENKNYTELCGKLAEGILTVSTKMHPLIISTSFNIPTIGISYNYKVDDFMAFIDSKDTCFNIEKLDADKMIKALKCKVSDENISVSDDKKKMVYYMFDEIQTICRDL